MKLRYNREEWVNQRRRQHQGEAERRQTDDGMSHGIIPFGTILQWQAMEEKRLAAALSGPLEARITGWDATGIGLAVTCPYCRQPHKHIVSEDGWQPHEPLNALCSKGQYYVSLTQEASEIGF